MANRPMPTRVAECFTQTPVTRRVVIESSHVACCDGKGTEHPAGHCVIAEGLIEAVGPGRAPAALRDGAEIVDGSGTLLTPGLVNTHHHLYQWITRGIAPDATLFQWLTTLYPMWARLDESTTRAAVAANLAWLALSGCTTAADHHYVFPAGGGDLLAAEIDAATQIGLRFHPARGSMDLGASQGGLPPDEVTEDRDVILQASADALDRFHDPAPGAMVRIALAPCSPFSVTGELMREAAELARARRVRLHTHLAETDDEDTFCRERFGCSPAEYVEQLGWLGDDVWMAHCVHLQPAAVDRFAQTGTSVAHCPSSNGRLGAGAAPVRELLRAGVSVGLGVDGAASNESGRLVDELRQALLTARVRGGPLALAAREALQMATRGGARCLGRDGELGTLAPGMLADLALWRVDGLAGEGIEDPVATLVFGAPVLDRLYVGGTPVVRGGLLQTADPAALAADAGDAARTLQTAL
jgi:cytosine/adenosine deaminase-related metal-dependent hydrolase